MAKSTVAKAAAETALTKLGSYLPMSKSREELIQRFGELRETLGEGQTLRPFDLQKFKIPTGGQTNWTIRDLTGKESLVPAIRGVVIHHQLMRSFWREKYGEKGVGQPPDCWSPDSRHGIGDPGIPCIECEYAEFKSAADGIGQACKQVDMCFILREGNLLPDVIGVTPGSLGNFKKFLTQLINAMKPLSSLVLEFHLEKTKNARNIDYARILPRVVYEMNDEEKARISAYSSMIKPLLGQVNLSEMAGDFVRTEEATA